VRLHDQLGLRLQPLHLQELQLLTPRSDAPSAPCRGCPNLAIRDRALKSVLFLLCGSVAFAALAAPAVGQQMNMPGMSMPPERAVTKKPGRKAGAKKKTAAKKGSVTAKPVSTALPPSPREGMRMPMPPPPARQSPTNHAAMPMPGTTPASGAGMPTGNVAMQNGHQMTMTGALGSYPMQRESSGTAWQPDASQHMGLMTISGDWMLMAHGLLNLVYDHQSSPRGDDKAFASGMLMGMASHPLGRGTVEFKAMISPDPLMGSRGYPLLLASGETANGRDRLIDRQHPHDLFMELSGSISQKIGPNSSVFVYAGLPGEPAFGPPAFMHRESIVDSPEAPISHHWLDSTHISFGVLTAGVVLDRVKLEVSRFNGREPDQHRWNIETGPLDSTAIRVSWNPTRSLALQGSWGHFVDPEQLEPGVDQKRLSASALYAREIAPGWKLAGTLAWGRKSARGHNDDAYVGEASLKHAGWTAFGRGEMTENRELLDTQSSGPAHRVGKVSLGAVRDFRIVEHLSFGAGGLLAVNFVPNALVPLYGGQNPLGAMGFVRLKLY